MPESTPNAKGPAPVQGKPEDVATLSIEYRDNQPVIVVSGGKAIPAGLTVVDAGGQAVAVYTASDVPKAQARLVFDQAFGMHTIYNDVTLDEDGSVIAVGGDVGDREGMAR
ncbi:hypothetical protein ACFWBH_06365 [Streptomyces sp. NPDC059999]|uniref:hypothetical protein n=1 Tax=Streptomyces sp. NPDC059999 TaxID=3347030 RepID=UPI0036BD366D